ncbi:MAG: PAS domain-containing protein [Cytophagaceae bacterium]|nr:PAS domain-containing protein [Gemmatimonadaceae bacterium]
MPDFARHVLDALPSTVYTTDLEGRITSANRSWSRFAVENGAPALANEASVRGTSLLDAFNDPGYRTQVMQALDLLRSGAVPKVTWEFPCSSPTEERVFLMHITPLREGGLPITGFVFSTVDITPSHRSREALMDTSLALARPIDIDRVFVEVGHQLRRAVPALEFSVWITESDGVNTRQVYALAEDGDISGTEARFATVVSEAIARRDVAVSMTAGGQCLAAPMEAGGQSLGAMALYSESLGTRQEVEEAVRVLATIAAQAGAAIDRSRLVHRVGQKRRLEAIGEVATGVAHELRNPLFGISSAAQLLRFRAREDVVVEKNVGRILREVDRLSRMVTSLLEFGRPKPTILAPFDPDVAWDEVLDGQRGLLESRSLFVRRGRPPHPVVIHADAEKIAQVFLNLLVNAADHAPVASDLTLESTLLPSGAWRMHLTNPGPAVPPDVLERVFEMFYSTKSGGTGIGLALCQRIVEEHGGHIAMRSSAEAGTSVSIELPASPPTPAQQA